MRCGSGSSEAAGPKAGRADARELDAGRLWAEPTARAAARRRRCEWASRLRRTARCVPPVVAAQSAAVAAAS